MIEKGRVRTRCYTWLVRDILTGSTMPKYTSLNQRIDAITRKVQGVAWKARGRILSVEISYTARLVKRCSMRYSTVQTSWASRYLFVFFFQADFSCNLLKVISGNSSFWFIVNLGRDLQTWRLLEVVFFFLFVCELHLTPTYESFKYNRQPNNLDQFQIVLCY